MAPFALFLVCFIHWSDAKALPAVSNQSWMMKDKGSLDGLSSLQRNSHTCRRNATCFPANQTTCLGVKLPYQYTSSDIIGLLPHQMFDRLQMLEGLHRVPKCWAAIQPLLCALFVPRCDPDTGMVDLPTHEMCKVALWPCRILNDTLQGWLPFFNCDDTERFPPECKNEVKEMRFNTTGQCVSPLVPTDNPSSFYEGVEGCGLQCADPLLTAQERLQIHKMVAWGATLALLCNLFTVASFVVDWRSANKYPSLIIFYINFCFMISNLGWLAQFIPGAREDVVCRKDGTLRLSEPSAGENLSCVIVFVMVYYFLMAACVWFVILTYAWHLRFKALDKIQERFDKKAAYFHLIAWSLPLVLTISTMAAGQIDGNSVAGVCFVGYSSHSARILLLIFPVVSAAVVGAYFLFRVLATLINIKIGSNEIISEKASAKIRYTIIRVGLFLLLCAIFVITSLICQVYEIQHEDEWKRSLRKYIICRVNPFENSECKMASRPSVAMIQLHLLALFLAGVLMSFWVWTSSTRETWKRSLRRMFSRDVRNRAIMKKHKIIAQAYSKRKELNDAGRLSISIHETHTDPVGLNFELNSVESQDFSSTWAAALPKLVTRRGALIDATTESNSSHHRRRNSYDSEISYSVRRVSVESRRHSLDSQISVQIAELTATRKTSATPRPHAGSSRRSSKRRRREYGRGRRYQRRGSSTSQDSQMGMQILTALTMGNSSILPSLLKRRPGNAGLDGSPGLGGGFPMIQPRPSRPSEDELTNTELPHDEDVDQSGGSEGVLCALGQGIQSMHVRESDSDVASVRKPLPSSRRNRLESISSGRRKNRDGGHSDTRRSSRKKIQVKKSEDREVAKSRDSGTGRKKRSSDGDTKGKYSMCKTEDYSDEEASDWKRSDSDSDDDGNRKHSVGTQFGRRADSSRSKRSVDVATQVSMQEMATQTEPEVAPTASQGTQMTPPFHIRLINKTLGSNGHSVGATATASPGLRYHDLWLKEQEAMSAK